ncbi:MAG: hypothetical protein OXN17_02785 [Candidatus Poribacteria bacterium]|nr:hypothetical protein [Candidatus Poribacteria bacterium]MDE0506356.1 hypothetical protein [Candidatus Poribacteria bacterium]
MRKAVPWRGHRKWAATGPAAKQSLNGERLMGGDKTEESDSFV